MHVAVTTPAETIDFVRSYSSIVSSFPRKRSGSASAFSVSRLARRSLTLQPTCSPSRLNGPLHRRLRQLCYLYRRFDCYRAERTSSRVGLPPTGKHRLSRRTSLRGVTKTIAHSRLAMQPLNRSGPRADRWSTNQHKSAIFWCPRYTKETWDTYMTLSGYLVVVSRFHRSQNRDHWGTPDHLWNSLPRTRATRL